MGCHLTCPEFSQEPQRRAPGGVEGSGRRQPRRGELTPGRAPPRSHRPSRPEPSTPRRSDRHAARTCSRSPGRAEKEHAEEEEEEQRPPRHGPAGSAPPPGPPASLPRSRDDCRCPRSGTGGGRDRGSASHLQRGCRRRREVRRDRRPARGRRWLPPGPTPPPPLDRARPSGRPVVARRCSLRGAAP